jgi:hypothetical protein
MIMDAKHFKSIRMDPQTEKCLVRKANRYGLPLRRLISYDAFYLKNCDKPLAIPLPQERDLAKARQADSLRYYGTILVAGSLQGPWPLAFTAATRNQMRAPEVRPGTVKVDLVETPRCCHEVAVGGSALESIT